MCNGHEMMRYNGEKTTRTGEGNFTQLKDVVKWGKLVRAVPVVLPSAQILVQQFEPEIALHSRRLVLHLDKTIAQDGMEWNDISE
jgi:hypothetical protein